MIEQFFFILSRYSYYTAPLLSHYYIVCQ